MDQLTDYAAEISRPSGFHGKRPRQRPTVFRRIRTGGCSSPAEAEEVSSGLSDGFREMEEEV